GVRDLRSARLCRYCAAARRRGFGMSVEPRVTVCVPAFQAARFVREAVESALAQRGVDLEVVVFDDASTDGTIAALGGIDDARLRLFRQPANVGISQNRNSCIEVARGRYFAWLDADDVLCEGSLAR